MLKLSYDLTAAWRLSGDVNVVNAYSEDPGPVSKPLTDSHADILRMMSWISLENHYERTDGGINFYYNAGRHIINDGYPAGGSPQAYLFHSTDYQGGLNLFQAFRPWEGGTLTAGFDLKLYGGDAYRNPETEYYADHKKLNEKAGYLLAQQILGPVTFEGGVRLENHSLYGTVWVPQAGISWLATPTTAIKLSASKGFRTPNMRELYMFPPHNEELEPEQAWSYDLTWSQHYLEGRFNTEVSLFYTKGTNLIAVAVVDGRKKNLNVGEFLNKGVEFSADYRVNDQFKFNANYSYINMDTPLVGTPVHKAYVSGTWTPGRFSANLGLMGIKDLYLDAAEDAPTSSYVDLMARVSYQITDWMTAFVRGENLLNCQYQTLVGFPEPGITVLGGLSLTL